MVVISYLKRLPWREILGIFIMTRLLLFFVTLLAFLYLPHYASPSSSWSLTTLFDVWNRWDASIYTRLGHTGYDQTEDLAFFPLYPMLIYAFSSVFGGNYAFLVGMVISNLTLLGALILIYQITIEMTDHTTARRTLLYLCIFPTAFFFFTAYNESLFILFSAGAILALRHQRWWIEGFCCFAAVLTRSSGAILGVAFLYELWLRHDVWHQSKRRFLLNAAPILLIPLGILLFSIYCYYFSGDPIAFATVQRRWSRQISWPWHGIWQNLFELFWNQPLASFNQVHILIDLSATLLFIFIIIRGARLLHPTYTIWTATLMFYYLISPSIWQHDALISNRRFVLEMFPAFITLALLSQRSPRLHQFLLWSSPALLTLFSLLFLSGEWMV